MPSLITKVTKRPEDSWFILTKDYVTEGLFTDAEKAAIDAFFQYTQSLPGLNPGVHGAILNGDEYTTIMAFDTLENAQAAEQKLYGINPDPIVANKDAIVRKKIEDLGYKYTRSSVIS